ncbi:hypothetical protein ACLMJK_006291 [Lecanora helva]
MGGYMTLTLNGKIHRGWLTNSHVVGPADSAHKNVIRGYDICGVSINDSDDDPVKAQTHWMAIKDVSATSKDIEDEIGYLEAREEHLRTEIEEKQSIGKKTIVEANAIARVRNDLPLLRSALNICSTLPHPMGKPLFSTGRALSPSNQILDIAFVSLPEADLSMRSKWETCMSDNILPGRNDPRFFRKLPQDFGVDRMSYANPPRILDTGPLILGGWYFKIGRTTDLTAGICHGTEAYINIDKEKRTKYDANWIRGTHETHGYSKENITLSAYISQGTVSMSTERFSDAGNSGSFIIDHLGRVCAQLRGSQHSPTDSQPEIRKHRRGGYGARIGLVTSMDRIIDAVSKMTAPRDSTTGLPNRPGAVLDVRLP